MNMIALMGLIGFLGFLGFYTGNYGYFGFVLTRKDLVVVYVLHANPMSWS